MTLMTTDGNPNREQAMLWNEASGRAWVEMQDVLDRMLAPASAALFEAAPPREGDRVLDVGCGAGATALAVAERVGPTGRCTGIDISAPLLALARRRGEESRLTTLSFVNADAQTHAFEPATFDAIVSRFGVMFFDDPERAFANLRHAARSGARLAFVAWRGPADNPFMAAAPRAAAPFLPALAPPKPDAPGQFGFSDGDRVRRLLVASGWTDVEVRPVDVRSVVATADIYAYAERVGPVGRALAGADEATRSKVREVIRTAYAPFEQNDGTVAFTSGCWLATARNA